VHGVLVHASPRGGRLNDDDRREKEERREERNALARRRQRAARRHFYSCFFFFRDGVFCLFSRRVFWRENEDEKADANCAHPREQEGANERPVWRALLFSLFSTVSVSPRSLSPPAFENKQQKSKTPKILASV
jgi:hypothetical protein